MRPKGSRPPVVPAIPGPATPMRVRVPLPARRCAPPPRPRCGIFFYGVNFLKKSGDVRWTCAPVVCKLELELVVFAQPGMAT